MRAEPALDLAVPRGNLEKGLHSFHGGYSALTARRGKHPEGGKEGGKARPPGIAPPRRRLFAILPYKERT